MTATKRLLLVLAVLVAAALPTAAWAEDNPNYVGTPPPSSEVLGENITRPTPAPAPQVEAVTVSRGALPFTGTDVIELVGLAGVLLAAGVVIVRTARRRDDANALG